MNSPKSVTLLKPFSEEAHEQWDKVMEVTQAIRDKVRVQGKTDHYYNNTLCFEGNTLIARPEGKGEGRTEGEA